MTEQFMLSFRCLHFTLVLFFVKNSGWMTKKCEFYSNRFHRTAHKYFMGVRTMTQSKCLHNKQTNRIQCIWNVKLKLLTSFRLCRKSVINFVVVGVSVKCNTKYLIYVVNWFSTECDTFHVFVHFGNLFGNQGRTIRIER